MQDHEQRAELLAKALRDILYSAPGIESYKLQIMAQKALLKFDPQPPFSLFDEPPHVQTESKPEIKENPDLLGLG